MISNYFLSTGRCGTTLISRILSSADHITISHQESGSRLVNIIGNISVHGLFPDNLLNSFLINYFGTQTLPNSTADPLRSIPIYLYFAQKKVDRKFRILHFVRDPRDFVTSFMNWKHNSIKHKILHHLVPFWQPNPWLAGDVTGLERLRMSKFEHFCWVWQFKNNLFSNFAEQENYLCLRFEDLILKKDKELWQDLFSFMKLTNTNVEDLEWPDKKINRSDKKNFSNWRNWSSKQARTLDRWCGGLMENFNYGQEKKWQKILK